jgi:hypothetical protein
VAARDRSETTEDKKLAHDHPMLFMPLKARNR